MIAFAHDNVIAMPTKSNEWYTPARYVEAAREVMGSIDLDPASSREANLVVRATQYYSETTNGYDKEWYGNVWLNPPFGDRHTPSVGKWVRKLVEQYQRGNIQEAVLLSTARVDTTWFQLLWSHPICFSDHKIIFHRPYHKYDDGLWHGVIFIYFGTNEQRFIDIFSKFGTVARRVSKPKEKPIMLSLWDTPPAPGMPPQVQAPMPGQPGQNPFVGGGQ